MNNKMANRPVPSSACMRQTQSCEQKRATFLGHVLFLQLGWDVLVILAGAVCVGQVAHGPSQATCLPRWWAAGLLCRYSFFCSN